MPIIDITLFKGEIPAADHKILPENAATLAVNAYFGHGRIEPYKANTPVAASLRGGIVESIYLYENAHWFSWSDWVNAVKSPVAQDAYRRIYYTDDVGAKVTSNLIATGSGVMPVASYSLGVPAPTTAISGIVNGSGADPDDYLDDETRFYVMTFVTGYGEEGPIGPVSSALELKGPNDTVTLTLPGIGLDTHNVTRKRIYRTSIGNAADFLFVAEVPLSAASFTDNLAGGQLGAVLETADYVPPPAGAKGMIALAGGSLAVFKENEVAVSEPYLPYAYPFAYRQSTEYDIVALAPTRYGLVIGTEGKPYILSGGHPSAMALEELDEEQACVSARSMVDMGSFVLYASPDGLVAVSESAASLITENIVKKDDWKQFHPESIHAYRYENKYIAFYGGDGLGGGVGGFVFDPKDGSFVRLDQYATAGYSDTKTDTLYLVIGGSLFAWNSAQTPLALTWRSKVFDTPEVGFACMRIDSPDPTKFNLKIWADGQEVLFVEQLPVSVFKLPMIKARAWQFELTGTGQTPRITLATDMSEI